MAENKILDENPEINKWADRLYIRLADRLTYRKNETGAPIPEPIEIERKPDATEQRLPTDFNPVS